jgi:hypothetical protein
LKKSIQKTTKNIQLDLNMSDKFYHAFYSQTYHNNPKDLIIYGETIGPNPIKKEVSYFISAGNSTRPLTNEELIKTLKGNKHWAKDTNYIGVVSLLDRTNYMVRRHLLVSKYLTFCGYTEESDEHNTTT